MKRYFLYIFLLIFIVGFLILLGVNKEIAGNFLNKIKSNFLNFNLFTATVVPGPSSFEDSGLDFSEINFENLIPTKQRDPTSSTRLGLVSGGKIILVVEDTEEELNEIAPGPEIEAQLTLAEIQEILDDIAERIDVVSQEIAELVEESQQTSEEIFDEDEEEREEEKQEEEEEKEKKEEEEGICLDGININTTSKEELEKIASVGPVIAQRIIEARPFSSIYDLTRVSGIGEKTLQNIIEQGCAYIEGDTGPGGAGGGSGGGTSPSPAVTYPEILISEVKIAEKTGDKNVFIELYNPNEIEVDLTDWYIFRNDSSFIIKTLFEGEKIPLKDYFLITKNGAIWENQADVLFDDKTLNEDDKIALKNPNGEVVDEIFWSQIPSGFSLGRKWDGQNYGDFEIQIPTPKAENSSLPLPLEDITPPEVIFNLEPIQTSLSFTLSWTATDPIGSAAPSGLEAFYLQYNVIPPIPSGDVVIVQYQNQAGEWKDWPILGDLNNDQNVDFKDYAILSKSDYWMNQNCVSPDWCEGADFNKDGQVDNFDLEIFTSCWPNKDKKIGEVVLDFQKTELNVLGKDGYTYNFQIRAEDKAGNFSDWQEAATTINLPKVLINEIQIDSQIGSGGTDDDWVELYNPYDVDVSLAGWSIQKHSSDLIHEPCSINKSFYKKNFSDTAVIPANGFFLIVDTQANESLKNIADMTIGWLLTDNNTVYLVRNEEPIESGEDLDIVDKVGFGLACFPEGSPALNPPEEKSIERKELGLDTDDNSQDFKINDIPTPTNSR